MTVPGPSPPDVRAHLNRILASSAFRSSKRSKDFLCLVVERALAGHAEDLKERTIGVELFGRDPDYDTHEDAIVRVKANEIRKRLAQYYQAEGALDKVRIELPAGSYHPEFQMVAGGQPEMAPATPELEPERRVTGQPVPAWLVLGAVVLAGALMWWWLRPPTNVERFWGPMLEARQPILFHLGHSINYQFSRRIHEEFLRAHPELMDSGQVYRIPLEPGNRFDAEDIVVQQDMTISTGSAMTIANIGAIFRQQDRDFQVKFGGVSPGEGGASLAVLVGAFNNPWTLAATRDLRFRYERQLTTGGTLMSIRDADSGKRWELHNVDTLGNTTIDYALVTRLMDPRRKTMTVALGGITHFGTEAASLVMTSPRGMDQVAALAPRGWESKNMQILIQTGVVGRAAVNPEVLAVHVW